MDDNLWLRKQKDGRRAGICEDDTLAFISGRRDKLPREGQI